MSADLPHPALAPWPGILFERNPQPMWIVERDTLRFLSVNEAAVRDYGYTRAEFLAMSARDIRPPADVPRLLQVIEDRRRTSAAPLYPVGIWKHVRKDGASIDVEISVADLVYDGRPASLVLGHDVTERRRAERMLARSERTLQEAQAVAHVGSWEWNLGTDEVAWSDELYRICGVDPAAFKPGYAAMLTLIHPDDRARVRALVDAAVKDGGNLDYESRLVRPDGQVRVHYSRARTIVGLGGRPERMVGIRQDVTERKAAEEERARLLRNEREARAQAEDALARLREIQSVTDAALAHLGLDDLLPVMLRRLRDVVGADAANVLLLSEDGRGVTVRASEGIEGAVSAVGDSVPVGRGVAGTVAKLRQGVIIEDTSAVEGAGTGLRVRSVLASPLLVEGQLIGVLDVGTCHRRRFGDEDLRFLQLVADRVAPVIDRARLVEKLKEGREQLSAVSQRLVEAQESERREIARELHDEVGQLLTGLKLMLETNADRSRSEEMASVVNELMTRVRGLSMSLRPPMLDDLGVVPALLWLVEHYTTQTGVRVEFTHEGLDARFPPAVETAAFRIAQEALTNVARHAGVKLATLAVDADAERLRVEVRDAGRGFDVQATRGLARAGLAGMRERARLAGGGVTVESGPADGTRVRAVLPVRGAAAGEA